MNLYRNVANRGEHTVELIDKILIKGSFHFEISTQLCQVFVQYEHEKKNFMYKAADLNDLRSRALLIMNVDEKSKSDKKELRKEKLNKFVVLIDNAFEVQAICLQLKQAGHFGFASYENKCGREDMVALIKILQNQYDDWETEIKAIRTRYNYMNFFLSNQLYELYMFLKGNTQTDRKILATVGAVLRFMGLSTDTLYQIPKIYQKYTTPESGDHTKALENIGQTLNFISKIKDFSRDQKRIAEAQNVSFVEKVQPGKPYFAWLDESSPLVIKVLLALYCNTTNTLPLAYQVLFCHEDTSFEEIDLLIRRCEESTEISKQRICFQL
ncbi:RNF213 [Mytilus edulis]|uniref:RNF213 n=1 Tax=Mytilus edulis TaxID=6550 RepID=A0A8S3Q4Y6_MYTED|nr:RNF213 [Mytilus edulis]